MAEIVTIDGSNYDPDIPVASVVELLEKLMIDAKSGRLRGIACAEVLVGGEVQHSFAYGGYTLFDLAAAIMLLQHRFAAKHFGEDTERK